MNIEALHKNSAMLVNCRPTLTHSYGNLIRLYGLNRVVLIINKKLSFINTLRCLMALSPQTQQWRPFSMLSHYEDAVRCWVSRFGYRGVERHSELANQSGTVLGT